MVNNKFPLNHKIIISPTWFFQKDDSKMYDPERQEYMLMANDSKIKSSIKKRDYDGCVELLYHGLNINSLKDNNIYYDTFHIPIMNNQMSKLYKDIKKNPSHPFYTIIENTKKYIFDNIMEYIELISEDLQKVDFFIKNKKIHNETDIFLLADDGKTITLCRNNYDEDKCLGNSIEFIKEFTGENAQLEYGEFIKTFNSSSTVKITPSNTIGINLDSKYTTIRALKLIRCIIITNKWFNSQNQFIFDVLKNLLNKEGIETFEYRFV